MTSKPLTILVVGGTGATGRHLVRLLLDRGHRIRIIARSPHRLTETLRNRENAEVVAGTVLGMSGTELSRHVHGCDAIASCLGHALSPRGIFGPPWRLVTDTATRLCRAAQASEPLRPVRYVLMSSAGCPNRDLPERVSLGQWAVVGAIRAIIPPHADNEAAAEYFRRQIGQQNTAIGWVIVRPDTLIDSDRVTPYKIHPSPTRSAIFDPGKTSRINVADWMAQLLTCQITWSRWAGQMPVIYNQAP